MHVLEKLLIREGITSEKNLFGAIAHVIHLFSCQQSQIKQRNPSVTVSSSWPVVEEIEFSRLAKLNFPVSAAPEDL